MRMRLLLVVAMLGLAVPAQGERRPEDRPVDDGPKAVFGEISHTLDVTVDRGVALLTVTRVFLNGTQAVDEARHTLQLPPGGAVTGMRLLTDDGWLSAAHLDAGVADIRYAELKSPGPAAPRTVALMSWGSSGTVDLAMFPLLPGALTTVEYTVTAPLGYAAGQRLLRYPDAGEVKVSVGRVPAGATTAHVTDVDTEEDMLRVAVPYAPVAPLDARWGAAQLGGTGREILRLEVDAATELAPAPRNAQVVFVIDGSYSADEGGIAAQLALVRGYLTHLPDARVEIVVFRRTADRLLGRFAPVGELDGLLAALARPRLEPGNGSNLHEGLALAAAALAGAKGPARIVLMTDGRYPDAATTAAARAALARAPSGTILHAVHVTPYVDDVELSEQRFEDPTLTAVTDSYGGVTLAVSGGVGDPAEVARVMLGLVRPIRIDEFTVEATGIDAETFGAPEWFDEGTTFRAMFLTGAAPKEVVLRGRIWAKPWQRRLVPDAAFAARLAAFAIGDAGILSELDPVELAGAAQAAKAVTPVTSYLAEEPLAGPSTVGVEDLQGTTGGSSTYSSRCGGVRGYSTTGHSGAEDEYFQQLLRGWSEAGVAACARRAGGADLTGVTVEVESTVREIVGVVVTGAPSAEAGACLEDAFWAIRLGAEFNEAHRRTSVAFAATR